MTDRTFVQTQTVELARVQAAFGVIFIVAGVASFAARSAVPIVWFASPLCVCGGLLTLVGALHRYRQLGAELFRVEVRDRVVSWRHKDEEMVVPLSEVRRISLSTLDSEPELVFTMSSGASQRMWRVPFTQYLALYDHLAAIYEGPMYLNGIRRKSSAVAHH